MPELPDVENFRRTLALRGTGRRVDAVVVTDAGILRDVSPARLDAALRGHRFLEPERRGKWLVAWTDGPTPVVHFGMTGDLLWSPDDRDRHRHDRVVFVLDRGELRYRNMRKLGGLWLAEGPEDVERLLAGLGPDALAVGRGEFLERLDRRRGRIKPTMMDQSFVAGIGNLIADESLWVARIHPTREVGDLSPAERARLYRAVHSVVERTVEQYPAGFRVRWFDDRGRPASRCPRCRTELRRIVVDGRSTYLCPRCQV